MENEKELIIQLLIQDMQFRQLLNCIAKLGGRDTGSGTKIVLIIASLMNKRDASLEWVAGYMDHIGKAAGYPITMDGSNLLPLAEACYEYLLENN